MGSELFVYPPKSIILEGEYLTFLPSKEQSHLYHGSIAQVDQKIVVYCEKKKSRCLYYYDEKLNLVNKTETDNEWEGLNVNKVILLDENKRIYDQSAGLAITGFGKKDRILHFGIPGVWFYILDDDKNIIVAHQFNYSVGLQFTIEIYLSNKTYEICEQRRLEVPHGRLDLNLIFCYLLPSSIVSQYLKHNIIHAYRQDNAYYVIFHDDDKNIVVDRWDKNSRLRLMCLTCPEEYYQLNLLLKKQFVSFNGWKPFTSVTSEDYNVWRGRMLEFLVGIDDLTKLSINLLGIVVDYVACPIVKNCLAL